MQALLLSSTSCSSFNYLGHQNYINKLDGGGIHEDQKINKKLPQMILIILKQVRKNISNKRMGDRTYNMNQNGTAGNRIDSKNNTI